jgi:hypothetical protein
VHDFKRVLDQAALREVCGEDPNGVAFCYPARAVLDENLQYGVGFGEVDEGLAESRVAPIDVDEQRRGDCGAGQLGVG